MEDFNSYLISNRYPLKVRLDKIFRDLVEANGLSDFKFSLLLLNTNGKSSCVLIWLQDMANLTQHMLHVLFIHIKFSSVLVLLRITTELSPLLLMSLRTRWPMQSPSIEALK